MKEERTSPANSSIAKEEKTMKETERASETERKEES